MNCSRATGHVLKVFGAVVALGMAYSKPSRADEGPIPIAVDYRSGSTCAEDEQFTRQLQARLPRVRRVEVGKERLLFRLRFTGSGAESVGHFTMLEADGTATERTLPKGTCDELVSAMALIAAVLIEPNATVSTTAPAPPVVAPAPTQKEVKPAPAASSSRVGFQGGIGTIVEGAVAPKAALGLSLEAGVKVDTGTVLSPSLVAALVRTFPTRSESQRGTALFEWTALRLMAFPLKWPARDRFALRPGVFFDLGRLDASGERTTNRDTARITWTALGVLMRLEAMPVRRLTLSLDGGLVIPLRHDRFYFAPNDAGAGVFTIPQLSALGRLGVATHF